MDSYNTKEIHSFYIDALADLVIHFSTIDAEKCKIYTHKLSEVTRAQLELSKKIASLNHQYQVKAAESQLKKEAALKALVIQERNNNIIIYIGSAILFSLIVLLLIVRYQKKKRRISETLDDIG